MFRIKRYFKPYIIPIALSLILLFGKSLADLNLPNMMKNIVDTGILRYGFEGATPDQIAQMQAEGVDLLASQQGYILRTGLLMVSITLLSIICSLGVSFLGARVGAGLARRLRADIFRKVQSFSAMEFGKFGAASLITRTTNDVTQIQNLSILGIQAAFVAPIMGVGGIILILINNANMSWILALAFAIVLVIMGLALIYALPKFKILQKLNDKLTLIARENLTGVMVTRAFRTEAYEAKRFKTANEELMKTNHSVYKAMVFLFPSLTLLMNLINVLIIWVGGQHIMQGTAEVGQIMAFTEYATMVVFAFIMMSMIFVMFPRAAVSANRIADILETEVAIHDPENPKKPDEAMRGVVTFKDVSFGYPGASENVLENISFTAKPNQTTAIIGSTGSGKSTLVNLIPRFFEVTSGSIEVSGVDVREMTLHDLHKQIGYVPQKGSLISGTIESNLKYGNPNADDEFMKKCAKVAQAAEFIESKEGQYQSPIAQNAKNVSGGQKQRLSIARALVADTPILIFDDSFSAVDMKTDALLRAALKEHVTDKNVIIVAQRVSTIKTAEQIIVMDAGKMVGIGTHEELLKTCTQYYEIASSQMSKEELNA